MTEYHSEDPADHTTTLEDGHKELLNAYELAGARLIPLKPDKGGRGKSWQKRKITRKEIEANLVRGGGVGIQAGECSGWISAADLDHPIARRLASYYLPETLTSGKEGELPSHYVYIAEGLRFRSILDIDGEHLIDVVASHNGAGHQFVVEPSVHETKGAYKWTGGFNPSRIVRISAEELDRQVGLLGAATLLAVHYPARGKGRHDFGLCVAGFLLRNSVEDEDVHDLMSLARQMQPEKPTKGSRDGIRYAVESTAKRLEEGETATGGRTLEGLVPGLAKRLARALGWKRASMGEGRMDYYRTDYGNGQRFVDQHEALVRWVSKWHKWLVWDGRRWGLDDGEEVARLAHSTAKSIFDEAKQAGDPDKQKRLAQWAISSQSRGKIEGMLWSAAPYVSAKHDALDGDPWLLNCENGTVDLRSGELREADPEDLITKLAPVRYDPEAEAPVFEAFLERVLPDEALRGFVQRALGYALTGVTREHVLPFLYGRGANGKTTLISAVMHVLGDYAQQAAPDLLLAKQGAHPTELADLFRARFVACVEVEDGRRFAESLLKQLTGGDRIKARRMREDFWEFDPTHKVFLAANHRPTVRGTDNAIWRRIKLAPFTVQIPEAEQDKELPEKLQAEAPGILAWMVRGCLEWQEEGLGEPEAVSEATDKYRAEMDVLGAFLEEECVLGDELTATSAQLWEAWKEWSEEKGEFVGTEKKFAERLEERGFTGFKFTGGPNKDRRGRRGLALRGGYSGPDGGSGGSGGGGPESGGSAGGSGANRPLEAPISARAEDQPSAPAEDASQPSAPRLGLGKPDSRGPRRERRVAEGFSVLPREASSKSPVNPKHPPLPSAGAQPSAPDDIGGLVYLTREGGRFAWTTDAGEAALLGPCVFFDGGLRVHYKGTPGQ